jgi:hypothetical protein
MRVSIPHDLGKDEVRRRMRARLGDAEDKARGLLGSMTSLESEWTGEDTLAITVNAMGYSIPCSAAIGETALDFDVAIPPGVGFARGMIETAIREKGERLLG